ncbi:aromatic acid/H+ symport family MFS transporter [Acinetobacter sp. ANC 4558]|uniref:MFS transporter n=1 Tax=Acinetobacter sp. ANC 4558 TaxID=1977876 RepID=UPI000A35004D|nr:aromatic acid/H+ symport family MFS transporter [Acinetobacter sp. ANC 4558]OTG87003.1 aromatic acid/H+ symport family MFS transporter [Acinetobacter sp. ANC 4558]
MQNVNAVELIDRASLNKHHKILVFWCAVIMLFDGYDLVIYGSVLPHLMTEWQLSPQTAGLLGAASLMGMMLGAVTLGMAADKFGRKNIIIFCTILSSVAVTMNGFAHDTDTFFICRLLTGVGLGGAVPNLVTIIKEMAPGNYRNRLINFVLAFYGVGAIISGLAGLFLIPTFGWQATFWIAGTCIFLIPLMYKTFPESISYLIQKNRQDDVVKTLEKLNPAHQHQTNMMYVIETTSAKQKIPVVGLFTEGKASKTLLIWIGFAMVMLMVFGLNTWLPKLMNVGGYSLGSSITFLVTLNIGSILGTLIFGVIADKWGTKKTLIFGYLLAAASIGCLGFHPPAFILSLLLVIAGGATVGSMSVIHTLAADFYPANIRSTGVSFSAAMGRFGAIAGPLFGGVLLAMNLPFEQNFMVFALPGIIGALVIALFNQPKPTPIPRVVKG